MSISFEISTFIPAAPEAVYNAWLDSAQHTAMTGGGAVVNAEIEGAFTAWDGYISGKNLELEPGRRIVQAWRTVEFTETEADSRLEIIFEAEGDGARLTLHHSELPAHGMQYKQGWVDNYFEPMQPFFKD